MRVITLNLFKLFIYEILHIIYCFNVPSDEKIKIIPNQTYNIWKNLLLDFPSLQLLALGGSFELKTQISSYNLCVQMSKD